MLVQGLAAARRRRAAPLAASGGEGRARGGPRSSRRRGRCAAGVQVARGVEEGVEALQVQDSGVAVGRALRLARFLAGFSVGAERFSRAQAAAGAREAAVAGRTATFWAAESSTSRLRKLPSSSTAPFGKVRRSGAAQG